MRHAELVDEAPLVVPGDWNEGEAIIAQQSLLVHQKNWRKIGELTVNTAAYDITQCRTTYMIGRQEPAMDKFLVIGRLELDGPLPPSYGYTNLYSVDGVYVRVDSQGLQVGTQLYRFVVKSGNTLLSDMSQYFGARRLWARLSRQADMVVDVVDTEKDAVVAKGVQLHQGRLDADFDQQYWSYDINAKKHNIRFVLRDIAPSAPSPLSIGP